MTPYRQVCAGPTPQLLASAQTPPSSWHSHAWGHHTCTCVPGDEDTAWVLSTEHRKEHSASATGTTANGDRTRKQAGVRDPGEGPHARSAGERPKPSRAAGAPEAARRAGSLDSVLGTRPDPTQAGTGSVRGVRTEGSRAGTETPRPELLRQEGAQARGRGGQLRAGGGGVGEVL